MSPTPPDQILTVLQEGKIALRGEFMWGSNYTYLAQVQHGGIVLPTVYKPTKGVRQLWDFSSSSLARREVAAYLVSQALGWELVPPTAYRRDGPLGSGSLQLFIEHDPEYHYFNFSAEDRQRLRPTALFDLLVNNADRKGSHILLDADRHLWLIDHGICFHVDDKLRTVIWDFAGEEIPSKLRQDLSSLYNKLVPQQGNRIDVEESDLVRQLGHYLNAAEIDVLAHRTQDLVDSGCFPNPDPSRRQFPWPPV
jgi:uncharacterized repeat protein (TIGR03843 family)